MSINNSFQQQLQDLTLSLNPATGLPYPADLFQVADGQGTRRWQTVFATISSQSSTDGAPLGYLPSTIYGISNDSSTISSIVTTSYSTLSTMIGQGGIPGSITSPQLQSTVTWVQGPALYVNQAALVSSMTPFLIGNISYLSSLQSTTTGLGLAGYVSSLSLQSTNTGLGLIGYVSSLSLQSTTQGADAQLQSTVIGLGTANYISTSLLYSTVTGILYPITEPGGFFGAVVTGTSNPPYQNFSILTSNYLTANKYFNSTNAASNGIVVAGNLPSTVTGLISSLGSLGYVSTATLLSTSQGIQEAKQNIFVDRTGSLNIFNSQVFLSSVGAITFLSSFVNSTLVYKGENGPIVGLETGNSNLSFSTANLQLDVFSSLITSTSRVTIELYPTFTFDALTAGALASKTFPMHTYLQYSTILLSTNHEARVVGHSAADNFSNYYQQPIKMTFQGTQVQGNYAYPYILYHTMQGALSYNLNVGFRDSNLDVFFASTNSYFLSVQNLSF